MSVYVGKNLKKRVLTDRSGMDELVSESCIYYTPVSRYLPFFQTFASKIHKSSIKFVYNKPFLTKI